MKRDNATPITEKPAIFSLFPESAFLKTIADVRELIANRAYELFSARGFVHGHDVDDWFQAESELVTSIPVGLLETPDALKVNTVLPGYRAKDIQIHVEPQRLFISGQRDKTEQQSEQIFRSIDLPARIDPKRVKATFRNGELEIELPKAGEAKKVAVAAKVAA
jgi:HSP20 family protein